jgi:hypothetical protein
MDLRCLHRAHFSVAALKDEGFEAGHANVNRTEREWNASCSVMPPLTGKLY